LDVSKAAIYYHYRSKDALLHHLVDPLLDAIDTCITSHSHPPPSADTARQLLADYLTVLTAHREIVTWVATDVAVLNHPKLGPRIRAQNRELRTLLVAPDPSVPATLRAAAALGRSGARSSPSLRSTSPTPHTDKPSSTRPSPPWPWAGHPTTAARGGRASRAGG
jgi:AcrR family transcriptional regulator